MEKDQTVEEVKEIPSGKQAILVQKEEYSTEDLHNNDARVLMLLNEEGSNYSFKGIMRRLGIHQQSLARALRRLEEMGLVEKTKVGYHLIKIGSVAAPLSSKVQAQRREYMQLLQTYIPADIRPAEVVDVLVGKWFKNLRWVGLIESTAGFTLQWSSEDGSFQINFRMVSDYVVIETNASTEREKLQAMIGSYAIYEQIAKILQDRLLPRSAYVFQMPVNN